MKKKEAKSVNDEEFLKFFAEVQEIATELGITVDELLDTYNFLIKNDSSSNTVSKQA